MSGAYYPEMPEPSPRPWTINRMTWTSSATVVGWHITNDVDGSVTPVLSSEISIGGMRDQEIVNLKHAVDCVNAHDELVAALESIRIDVDMGISLLHEAGTDPEAWLDSARSKIDEALARVRGTES